jgi:predicted negative regulator of RcsB-dependent stress response
MRFLLVLLLLLISRSAPASEYYFDYNGNCAAAYKAYMALRIEEGDALVRRELVSHPYNLAATYVSDYGDGITLLFNGDPYQMDQRNAHEDERLTRLSKASEDDPWKRLALSAVRLHWALIRMRNGEQFSAAMGFRRSYLLLKENAARFPAFAADDALYGVEECLAGIIPESYKWITNMLGMKGDFNSGLNRLGGYLRRFPQDEHPFHEEALIYDAFIRFHYGGARQAVWQQISSDGYFPVSGNLMRCFFRANLGIAYRKADVALSTLQTAEALPHATQWPVIDFEMGSALLLRLDASCLSYFDRYLKRNKGKLFTKDALQQAAYAAYVQGNLALANTYRRRIQEEGNQRTDADKQAQRFGKGSNWPAPVLVSARLLIDGGYANQALQKLRATNEAAFTDLANKLEYNFRLGRALEETGDVYSAVQVYQRTIVLGRERPEHFAARAALQMGGIYEARGQKAEARRYYGAALGMRNHDFQASIDQQAKAGLARLGA